MNNMYGYARVSSKEQNEERQIIALKGQNIKEKDIYIYKISGKDFNRPMYKKRQEQGIAAAKKAWCAYGKTANNS